MTCPKCGHSDELTFVYFDKPLRCVLCVNCDWSQVVNERASPRSQLDGDGRTADGCMDDVHTEPHCSKTEKHLKVTRKKSGPSGSPTTAGNSNRMVGLLRTPPKGVVW